MNCIATLTVKMPRWRIRLSRVGLAVIAPFVRKQATADRIGAAVVAWIGRGLVVKAETRPGG